MTRVCVCFYCVSSLYTACIAHINHYNLSLYTLYTMSYTQIKLSEILKLDNRTARILVSEAAEILSLWSETYFSTRKRIEETSDHRWEFDRKILFGRTDYMSNICHHIIEILDGLEGFKFFLGPQLRSLTGEGAIGMREVYVFVGVWHL